jgi:hypothetical protein
MAKSLPKKRTISVVDRRLQSGSMFASLSRPMPLVEPNKWETHITNSQISDQRLWEMTEVKGWEYLTPQDLAVEPSAIGYREQDGRVVRGEKGHEVLMKMTIPDWKRVQKKKDEDVRRDTYGKDAAKRSILAAAGREPGGANGAEFLERSLNRIKITDTRESVSLED